MPIKEAMIALDERFAGEMDFSAPDLKRLLPQVLEKSEGFSSLLDDEATRIEIEDFVARKSFKFVVLLGIGGSALGAKAIRDVCASLVLRQRFFILENLDPAVMREVEENIQLEKTLFLVISKSGDTLESLATYFYFRERLKNASLDPTKHSVFVTDPQKGFLRELARKEGVPTFSIPSGVGGRFSVLSSVGLLPARLLGIDLNALIRGAQKMRSYFFCETPEENLPYRIAKYQYEWFLKGKTNVVFMPYSSQLKTLGAWYGQLLAESTGKIDIKGENVGLTPLLAEGSTDQHSQLQLYMQGKPDKQFLFLLNKKNDQEKKISVEFPEFKYLKGITFSEILKIQKDSTAESLFETGKESLTIEISEITPETLGALFFLFEGVIAFLGELFQIDAFDQPGVERSKVLTRSFLIAQKGNL